MRLPSPETSRASALLILSLLFSLHAGAQPSESPAFSRISGLSTSPAVQWHSVPGAERYEFQVSLDPGFSTLVLDDTAVAETLLTLGPLVPDTGYYCRVIALLPGGLASWSAILPFYAEAGRNVFPFSGSLGWNLISLPLSVSDAVRNFLFPGPCHPPAAFCFRGSYDCCEMYSPQSYGFWTKLPDDRLIGVTGIPLAADTEAVEKGWNLIGSIFDSVSVASLITSPPGLIEGEIFGFSGGLYTIADTIAPFGGYWLKASAPGRIILSAIPQSMSRIVAYVHWQNQPIAGKKIVLVGMRDTAFTDSNGLAAFTVPPGKYTVRAFGINRGGPAQLSVDFDVETQTGETTRLDIVDCLPCF